MDLNINKMKGKKVYSVLSTSFKAIMSLVKNKPTFEMFLSKVNDYIKDEAAKKDEERSYIRLFRPYNCNKVNIMGDFKDAIDAENNQARNFVVDSKRSFGMIAKEQFSKYCFLHSKARFVYDSFEIFLKYVAENYRNFVIDDSELENVIIRLEQFQDSCDLFKIYKSTGRNKENFKILLQKALYARCVMKAYYSCGLTILGSENQIRNLENKILLNLHKDNSWVKIDVHSIKKGKKQSTKEYYQLVIKGVPSDKTLSMIDEQTEIRIHEDGGKLFISDNAKDHKLSEYFNTAVRFVFDDCVCINQFINDLKVIGFGDLQKTDNGCVVKYVPSNQLITRFDEENNDSKQDRWYFVKKGDVIHVSHTIDEDYINKNNTLEYIYNEKLKRLKFYKSNAGALYSGVIPRLNGVEYKEPSMDNASLEGIFLTLGRTSYFTMVAMGRVVETGHPFMTNELNIEGYRGTFAQISEAFDKYEVMIQNEYYEKIEACDKKYREWMKDEINKYGSKIEEDISILNNYLENSLAQHNINISGNLITEDGVCLYTQRGDEIEDSGDYYPSVNGGSEIYDTDVDFYKNSVQEDIPSINYNKENVYFGQELTREAIAELGLIDDSHVWNFYGITCMGQKKEINDHRLSFHFNVIGERRCMDEFMHIGEQKKKSAENFESKDLFGYRFETHPNRRSQFGALFLNTLLPAIIDNKDTIVWVLILIYSLYRHKSLSENGIESMLSLAFVFASLIMILYRVYSWRILRKHEKVVSIVVNDSNILNIESLCSKIGENLNIKDMIHMDNVLRLLTLMRLSDYFSDSDS